MQQKNLYAIAEFSLTVMTMVVVLVTALIMGMANLIILHKWGNGPDYHLRGFTYTGYEPTGHGFAWSENEELAEWIALVNAESGG